ncbi:hypothetical protein KsCSTR_13550 [Candidatus Kuenenia stuttgartiensis]|uniref:Uncharacterized protein n=1 Tax=Kuenenia stuttgartiensis TaxID=174633 RepID=A0A6G7GN09_KUEST|nr:hypothetical protein KsCSTR_13550 [Candidatus Kuenenia stuttgartiensis]
MICSVVVFASLWICVVGVFKEIYFGQLYNGENIKIKGVAHG